MKNRWLYLLVGVVACFVAYFNWPKTGMIIGWDNLMTQFDVDMNIRRELSGVWQEYQGVGLLAGMGHAADLVRLGFEYLLTLVLPDNIIRAVEIFGMYILGGLGVMWLMGKLVDKEKINVPVAQMVVGVFYLVSLGTIQNFWVPFEPYYWAFGMFPWVLGSYIEYLEKGGRKLLLRLVLVSLLATPMGYLQTIYLVGLVFLLLFGVGYVLYRDKAEGVWERTKRVATAITVSLLVNAFWLLPQTYFFVTSVGVTTQAKMNQIATPEVALSNATSGDIGSVLKMEGYWLKLHDYQANGSFAYLMKPWVDHLGNVYVQYAQIALIIMVLVGFIYVMFVKSKWKYGVLLAMVFCLIVLQGNNDPFGYIYESVSKVMPIIGQIFRSPFTKVVVFWNLLQAICLGVTVGWLASIISRVRLLGAKLVGWIAVCLIFGMQIAVSWPIFSGNLVYQRLNLTLPQEYQELFHYFKSSPNGRIALAPVETLWGWKYHNWGYDGSGFLWYGIEQPILDRAFDVWSPYNEGFYNELSTAMYGGDKESVRDVLRKYDVRYVLSDESVIAPGQDKAILRIEETKKLASELGWEQKFHEGFLTVWETMPQATHAGGQAGFVSAPSAYTLAEGDTVKTRDDVIYAEQGIYVSGMDGLQYPFAGLMREETGSMLRYESGGVKLVTQLNSDTVSQLTVPGWEQGEWVELGYSLRLTANGLQIDWEPVYGVGEQKGPRLGASSWQLEAGGNYWVQVGENEAHYVKADSSEKGRAKLQVGEAIKINIYDGQGRVEKVAVGEEQKCGEKGELSCWATPLEKATRDSLVQTITHYKGEVSPEVCLDLEGEPYECVNLLKRGESPIVVTSPIAKGERIWVDWVARDSATKPEGLGVVIYPLIEKYEMGGESWGEFKKEQEFRIEGERVAVIVSREAKVYDFATEGKPTINNCDVLTRGSAAKNGSIYTADERGAACDYVEMTDLDTRLSYLMRIMGENKEGRSVKYFLWNSGSKRNDIEYLLGKNKFDQNFTLLPWEFGGSYSLNIETRSFGQKAENRLEPVEVAYFPLKQIAGARVGEVNKNENKLKIKGVSKTGTWLYRVEVGGAGLIRLSQGYDEGWTAGEIRNSKFEIRKLEHVKVDGWANGWILRPAQDKLGDEHKLWIFYWPQLLEYFGLWILGVAVVILIVYDTKSHIN